MVRRAVATVLEARAASGSRGGSRRARRPTLIREPNCGGWWPWVWDPRAKGWRQNGLRSPGWRRARRPDDGSNSTVTRPGPFASFPSRSTRCRRCPSGSPSWRWGPGLAARLPPRPPGARSRRSRRRIRPPPIGRAGTWPTASPNRPGPEIGPAEVRHLAGAVRVTTSWVGVENADLAIEAAAEDAGVKRNLFLELERRVRPRGAAPDGQHHGRGRGRPSRVEPARPGRRPSPAERRCPPAGCRAGRWPADRLRHPCGPRPVGAGLGILAGPRRRPAGTARGIGQARVPVRGGRPRRRGPASRPRGHRLPAVRHGPRPT